MGENRIPLAGGGCPNEWDIDTVLGASAAIVAGTGLLLGTRRRRWLMLPAVVGGLALEYQLHRRGIAWEFLRGLGFRTRSEIDAERAVAAGRWFPDEAAIDEAAADSFPASDPPSWTPTTAIGPPG